MTNWASGRLLSTPTREKTWKHGAGDSQTPLGGHDVTEGALRSVWARNISTKSEGGEVRFLISPQRPNEATFLVCIKQRHVIDKRMVNVETQRWRRRRLDCPAATRNSLDRPQRDDRRLWQRLVMTVAAGRPGLPRPRNTILEMLPRLEQPPAAKRTASLGFEHADLGLLFPISLRTIF
ncbi:hypothetical protein E2C01_011917 [Portunus trituberculatus]|uniref:Uncharacterized protein n=1 Tax=Portunus trituberculatus TaxID=210409 RepID=A0A5B7DC66_PORTR|nr:hypothetical protein [Portunus trituberculatus]